MNNVERRYNEIGREIALLKSEVQMGRKLNGFESFKVKTWLELIDGEDKACIKKAEELNKDRGSLTLLRKAFHIFADPKNFHVDERSPVVKTEVKREICAKYSAAVANWENSVGSRAKMHDGPKPSF